MNKLIFGALVLATMAVSKPAQAQECDGEVYGLSSVYNPATGSGFLAMRVKPRSSAAQVAELRNGDVVEITNHRKGWFFVSTQKLPIVEGWVSRKYMRTECRF